MTEKKTTENFKVGDGTPGPGRPKGVPNKATTAVREAIAVFAEANVGKMGEWLERVAADNPDRAMSLYLQAIEYHIPKLARSEQTISNPDGTPLIPGLTDEQINAKLAAYGVKVNG